MRAKHGLLVAALIVAVAAWPSTSPAGAPTARAGATCADHPNQASAQRAKDTRDSDGDGIYCVIYSG